MDFLETCKIRWARGTIIIKTLIEQYQDTDRITYKYNVREGNITIENGTTHKFGEVVKRILYYKGLQNNWRK